jgi:adhesin/invasin
VSGTPTADPTDGSEVTGTGEPGAEAVITDKDGNELCRAAIDAHGLWSCTFAPPLADGTDVWVKVVDPNDNESVDVKATVDAVPPDTPRVVNDPAQTNEDQVTIAGDPGDTVVVTDDSGRQVCAGTIGADGTFVCVLPDGVGEGDVLHITEADAAGNVSHQADWRVGVIKLEVKAPSLRRNQVQTVTGYNFQPGEKVGAEMHSTPVDLGTKVADKNGTVVFTWTIAKDTELAVHTAVLEGPLSGEAQGTFDVVDRDIPTQAHSSSRPSVAAATPSGAGRSLPFTGAADLGTAAALALSLALAGLWLIVAAKRRRKDDQHVGRL